MKESYIEKRFVEVCKRHGMRAIKQTAETGIPDRLVLFEGFAGFAEIKAPGKEPEPVQAAFIRKLKREGCFTGVVDGPLEIVCWIRDFKEHIRRKGWKSITS